MAWCFHLRKSSCMRTRLTRHSGARARITAAPQLCASTLVPPQLLRYHHSAQPPGCRRNRGAIPAIPGRRKDALREPACRCAGAAPTAVDVNPQRAQIALPRLSGRKIACACHTGSPTAPPQQGSAGRAAQRQKANSRANRLFGGAHDVAPAVPGSIAVPAGPSPARAPAAGALPPGRAEHRRVTPSRRVQTNGENPLNIRPQNGQNPANIGPHPCVEAGATSTKCSSQIRRCGSRLQSHICFCVARTVRALVQDEYLVDAPDQRIEDKPCAPAMVSTSPRPVAGGDAGVQGVQEDICSSRRHPCVSENPEPNPG